jgi:hypothetical protein
MWSNSQKMWNWDLNESLSFEEFSAIRDGFGDFPVMGSDSSADNPLPAPTAIATAVPLEYTVCQQCKTVLLKLIYLTAAIV